MDNGQFLGVVLSIGVIMKKTVGLRGRLLLFVSLFLFMVPAAFAQQQNSNLTLVDEVGVVNCEDLLLRLDSLANQVQDEPDSKGYIVIYPSPDFVYNFSFTNAIRNHFRFRNFDLDRFEVITGEPRNEILVQFWLGDKATKPDVDPHEISNTVPNSQIPLLASSEEFYLARSNGEYSYSTGDVCSVGSLNVLQMRQLLEINRNLSLKILIFGESRNNARRLKNLIVEELAKSGISSPDYVLETRIFLPDKKTEESIEESDRRFIVNFWLVARTENRDPI